MNQIAVRKTRAFFSVFVICIILLIYVSKRSAEFDVVYSSQIYRHVNHEESNVSSTDIQIVIVIEATTNLEFYKHALDTVKCYSGIHGYKLVIVTDNKFPNCTHKDKFFRRHCVVAQLLQNAEYTLFLDADIGVVNPRKKIQDFICEDVEIIFYDRFYNQEVMAGSYLVRRSTWSFNFLNGFADYEFRLPRSFHGTDNGALHAYLAEVILPGRSYEYYLCMELYKISRDYADLFAYEACIRSVLGSHESFGPIKILEKGTGWTRDNWLTNSKWNPHSDFMIHGWKLNQLLDLRNERMPLSIQEKSRSTWFNPLLGDIHLNLCTESNLTWSYDPRLLATTDEIEDKLTLFRHSVDMDKFKHLAHLTERLQVSHP